MLNRSKHLTGNRHSGSGATFSYDFRHPDHVSQSKINEMYISRGQQAMNTH